MAAAKSSQIHFHWGNDGMNGSDHKVDKRRCPAEMQLSEFQSAWNSWDELNLGKFRPLQERHKRHVFFINAHWSQYKSLLPRIQDPDITFLSRAYREITLILPLQNYPEMSRLMPKHVQSPIPISTTQCPQFTLQPLNFKGYWDNELKGTLLNNGKTAYFSYDSDNQPSISGGPLNGEYVFEQMHFHWSGDDFSGCEHLLDGHGYAAECHFVHVKRDYGNKDEASKCEDGLVVVGFFLEAVNDDNPGFQKLIKGFQQIKTSAHSIPVNAESLAWLKNYDLRGGNYITYKGSLTTPPYTECVTWILYEDPVQISHDQIALLRQLEGPDCEPIKRNVRPIQLHPPCGSVVFVKPYTCKQ